MSKTNQLGNAMKSTHRLLQSRPTQQQNIPLLVRAFSNEADPAASAVNSFIQNPSSGLAYGRLLGITKHTLKSDVAKMLEGCNLSPEDVKVDYNHYYAPMAMLIQFPSRFAYDNAFRVITRKGRLYKLEQAGRSHWDILTPYDGKYALLHGVPRNAQTDDIERFLSGCDYDSSSIQYILRANNQDAKMVLVRFSSPTQAMNAYITKNRGFCMNSQITVQVLQ